MSSMNYFLIFACKAQRENAQIIDDLRLITRFVTRVTGRVPLVEQDLLIFPEHLCSPSDFGVVRVTQSLVLWIMCCRSLLIVISPFFFLLAFAMFVLVRFTILITALVSSNSSMLISNFGIYPDNKYSFSWYDHW